jgi:uncharacterized glyoxalase superfamily protein PhnB
VSDREHEQSTLPARPAHGQLCYLQIPARDVAASARFYACVFGWRVALPGAGFEAPGLIGEWTTERDPALNAGSVGWIMVGDVVETLAEAERGGATVRQGPTPDGPRTLASFLDPAGNLIGIVQLGDRPSVGGNRTMPSAGMFPVLVYDDVPGAIRWLCDAFGFAERWRADAHRAILEFQNGAVMLGDRDPEGEAEAHSIMVRVADADAHCARARRAGARVCEAPRDFKYGERQYTAIDLGGHRWTFSQSIADRAPEEWGGTSGPAQPPPPPAAGNPPVT